MVEDRHILSVKSEWESSCMSSVKRNGNIADNLDWPIDPSYHKSPLILNYGSYFISSERVKLES